MATKISDFFTLEDMVRSDKAKEKGVDNTPGDMHRENLEKLCKYVLDPIRRKWGKTIHINSGYRGPRLNSIVKGSEKSDHCSGCAADISTWDRAENKRLFDMIRNMPDEIPWGQLINENDYQWIHISLKTSAHSGEVFAIRNGATVKGSMQKVLGYCTGDK